MEEFEQISNVHQLWVNLSSLGEGNVFVQLPELIKSMIAPEILDEEGIEDEFNYTLSSDYEWRLKVYFHILRKMRQEGWMPVPWREEEVVQLHHWNIVSKPTVHNCCPEAERLNKKDVTFLPTLITWTVSDIAKAAQLLSLPPINTTFEDEQEMRRVYTLIYDTFRYKGILNQALNDISFYQMYPEKLCSHIWLLFFDLYHRSFKKRETAVISSAEQLFQKAGIMVAEEALWKQRVKLAAAVARLRIKNSALRLSELLPKHLRDGRIICQAQTCPVTCWINPHKVKNQEEIIRILERSLKLKPLHMSKQLEPNYYKLDSLCPNFITFHCSLRGTLAKNPLVQKHKLVVQDRSFCLGPATFGKIILDLELAGTVVQTHVNSPRTTAYLATLLSQNSKIKNLLVFSAGSRKEEYESYFQELGMTNVCIYSEKLIDIPPDSNCLERVIAVFATPPNSYSAVSDPIDLVCSRGGDLSMLEILTESEVTEEGKKRVTRILEEQRKTLKFAMSRPQIQVVLYETHSELEVENDAMVQKSLKEVNKLAKLKHAAIQGKLRIQSSELLFQEVKEINNNENIKFDFASSEQSSSDQSKKHSAATSIETVEVFDRIYKDVVVPNCDLFDKPDLPSLCPSSECCLKLEDEGCYLALLQRKEVIRIDNKYMIEMAESRALFGNNSNTSAVTKGSRASKSKKQEKRPVSPNPGKSHNKRKTKLIEALELLDNAVSDVKCITNKWEIQKKLSLQNQKIWQRAKERMDQINSHYINDDDDDCDVSLGVLESLLQSKETLKDLISSRLPYNSIKHKLPSYGWKYFVDNSILSDDSDDDPDSQVSNNSKTNRSHSRNSSMSSTHSKRKKFHALPAEVMHRVTQPTYNSLTRSTAKDESGANRNFVRHCKVCERRNMIP